MARLMCAQCKHDDHEGRLCGQYVTKDIHDDVGFAGPPSGQTVTVIERVCKCERVWIEIQTLVPSEMDSLLGGFTKHRWHCHTCKARGDNPHTGAEHPDGKVIKEAIYQHMRAKHRGAVWDPNYRPPKPAPLPLRDRIDAVLDRLSTEVAQCGSHDHRTSVTQHVAALREQLKEVTWPK